jgi:DNA-binding MarR family transcriptional regulator
MNTETQQIPAKPRPPKELARSVAHLLKRLGFSVKERSVEAFEGTDLGPGHYSVLVLLEEEPRETQAQIADALGFDRSHLVGVLDELEERGYIERRRDPDDRRRHLVSLTADGKSKLEELRSLVKQVEDEFLAPLDADQRRQLHELLLLLATHHYPRYAGCAD